jgi:hypothetical protein
MFIAMNRFRVKKGSEGAFEKVWLGRDTFSIVFRVSWNFICSRARRRKTIRSIPRIACGKASRLSRRGPSRKNFGPRTRARATRQLDRSIWNIQNLRVSKYVRPSLESQRPREPQLSPLAELPQRPDRRSVPPRGPTNGSRRQQSTQHDKRSCHDTCARKALRICRPMFFAFS